MAVKILSLYLRAGTGAARLAFKLTERAVTLAGSVIGLTDRDSAAAPNAEPWMESSEAQPAAAVAERAAAEAEPGLAETEDLAAPPVLTAAERRHKEISGPTGS